MFAAWLVIINDRVQLRYGEFMHGLKEDNIQLNRKVLSELAMDEPYSFKALVDQVKHMRAEPVQAI